MAWPSVLPAGLAQAVHTAGASLSTSALSFLLPTCSSSGKAASGGLERALALEAVQCAG